MSFQAPLLLGLLALVPLAAAALRARRSGGARKFAVRYTNVDLLAAVAGPLVDAPRPGACSRCSRSRRC